MYGNSKLEPWLRGTMKNIPAVHRAILHAFELAEEDLSRWCSDLTAQQLDASPGGAASVAFHIRHISRSIDRLLTYAEANPLSEQQLAALKTEMESGAEAGKLFEELRSTLASASDRVRALIGADLEAARAVGRQGLPTSVGGLLVHVADHTQRHVGQAITTAKIVRSSLL